MEKNLLDYMKQVTDYYTKPSQLSANEVVAIFLEEKKEQKQEQQAQAGSQQVMENVDLVPMQMDLDELEKWRNKNNNKYAIRASLPITSHRKIIGKIIVRLKRIARHCLKWYIDPIVEQQNELNGSLTASINAIYNNDVVANQFIQQAAMKLNDQENKLNQQARELTGAFNEIEKLSQIIDNLKNELHTLNSNQMNLEEQIASQEQAFEAKLNNQGENFEAKVNDQEQAFKLSLAVQEEKLITQNLECNKAIEKLNCEMNQKLVAQMSDINNLVDQTQEKYTLPNL